MSTKKKRPSAKTTDTERAAEDVQSSQEGNDVQGYMDPAAERFVKDVVARGEAAHLEDGKLPPGATHEIVGEGEGGLPKIRRRRFNLT